MNKEIVVKNKNEAIKIITNYLDSNLESSNEDNIKKVNIISYWFKDYINYINSENDFNPVNLKTYERGDVIKVNLGFNIGSELGGLHYCVVIDKKNNRNSPVITVVPLFSQKKDKVNKNSVVLGNDIYVKMLDKSNKLFEKYINKNDDNKEKLVLEKQKLSEMDKNLELAQKLNKEIQKMKNGSIAIVNQVRVVSKQRIYDPKTNLDVLAGIKLSNKNLDLIDDMMIKLFVKNI